MAAPRETPAWLLALGCDAPPKEIELDGVRYRHEQTFKHDFFACTGCYREVDGPRAVVLKIGRRAPAFGLPLSWIGRLHVAHEAAVLRALDDLELVPAFTGWWGRHALTHDFVEGHALERGERAPDGFFEQLEEGLARIHARGLAVVDLEKPENVLVGDDGRPWLFDFQISFRWPFRRGGELWPVRAVRRRFQESDRYHLTKLRRRCRPDTMTEEELAASRRRPWYLRWHGKLVRPFKVLRRRLLHRIDPVAKRGERGRVPMSPVASVSPEAGDDRAPA